MHKILFQPQFKAIMSAHTRDILQILLHHGVNFNILCDMKKTSFQPQLPQYITETFNEITLFVLAGYTFESIELHEGHISFEAGFGSENIGSFVSIDFSGIVQILLHDNDLLREIPLFTNASHPCLYNFSDEELQEIEFLQKEGLEHSNLAFALSPENGRFFKK